jgi:hypothetical protein
MLDGEIGDAAARIEPVGGRERRGRANVEAGPAAASITAAVSTNTFTSPPACCVSQRAMLLSRGLMMSW